jgi:hypothetical protein
MFVLLLGFQHALAHSGGTDANGCHAGSQPYHCHGSSKVQPSKSVPRARYEHTFTPPSRKLPDILQARAICVDRTVSYSAAPAGTCANHGGVLVWLSGSERYDGDGNPFVDTDGDGFPNQLSGGSDCDDTHSEIHPGAWDSPYDGMDQDCSGTDSDDLDGDGHRSVRVGGDDCDDTDRNTIAIEFGLDIDGDGFVGLSAERKLTCSAETPWRPITALDCNDSDEMIHPGSFDIPYDGVDQDCNGGDLRDGDGDGMPDISHGGNDCDDSNSHFQNFVGHPDGDGDGFGSSVTIRRCYSSDLVSDNSDCDDSNSIVHPSARDTPLDGTDSNCDGDDENDSSLKGHDILGSFDASSYDGFVAMRWRCLCGEIFDSKPLASGHVRTKQLNAAVNILAACQSKHGIGEGHWCMCGRHFGTNASFERHFVKHAQRTKCSQ